MGCAYTGNAGGPMRTEMPTVICAKDAAERHMTAIANSSQRTTIRLILICLPPVFTGSARTSSVYKAILTQKCSIGLITFRLCKHWTFEYVAGQKLPGLCGLGTGTPEPAKYTP